MTFLGLICQRPSADSLAWNADASFWKFSKCLEVVDKVETSRNDYDSDRVPFCCWLADDSFILLMRLLGRISVQFRFMNSRQAARLSDLRTMVQPSGTSMKLVPNAYCPSSLIKTWYMPRYGLK